MAGPGGLSDTDDRLDGVGAGGGSRDEVSDTPVTVSGNGPMGVIWRPRCPSDDPVITLSWTGMRADLVDASADGGVVKVKISGRLLWQFDDHEPFGIYHQDIWVIDMAFPELEHSCPDTPMGAGKWYLCTRTISGGEFSAEIAGPAGREIRLAASRCGAVAPCERLILKNENSMAFESCSWPPSIGRPPNEMAPDGKVGE